MAAPEISLEGSTEDLYNSAPCGYHSLDKNGVLVRINDTELRWLGYTRQELIGRVKLSELLTPSSREIFERDFATFLATGFVRNLELDLVRKDGGLLSVLVSASAVRDANGQFLRCRSTVYDITEFKKARQELHRSEERLQATLRNAPIVLFALDNVGIFTVSDGKGLEALALKPGEVVGQSIFDLYRDNPRVIDDARRALSGEEFATTVELPSLSKFYHTNWVQARDDQGKRTGVIGVATDITELRKTEEALRHSEERYRMFVTQSSEGIYRIEYEVPVNVLLPVSELMVLGFDRAYVAECNDALARMYGFDSARDLVGKHLTEVLGSPDWRRTLMEVFAKQGYRISDFETRHAVTRDKVRIFRHAMFGIFENGLLVRTWGVQRDVTDRVQLEEQLQGAQKLEAVGRLAGGVAHDFNNMLGVIIGYAHLLAEHVQLSERAQTDLERIRKAAESASTLTQQLLAFSRKQVRKPKVLDLNSIVIDMQKMLSHAMGEDIELVTRLHPGLVAVEADPVQMEQVVMNLAMNARDAMPHGGQLIMETSNAEADFSGPGKDSETPATHCALLTISDTGHGMDAGTLEHIFEPFFTTKAVGKGTGLGLSTVYGIVKQSGGGITVSSQPGKGTTFRIYLPAVASSIADSAEQSDSAVAGGTETVLVVEDDPHLREIARRFLESYGYQVLDAGDAAEAIQLVTTSSRPIDLLLTDVIMPGMSGRELAEKIQGEHSEMKVIYMTGYAEDVVVDRNVLETGVNILQKPFTRHDLGTTVRSVLDER